MIPPHDPARFPTLTLALGLFTLGLALACGGGEDTTKPSPLEATEPPPPVTVLNVVFTGGVDDQANPVDPRPAAHFNGTETVFLWLQLDDRPTGMLNGAWSLVDQPIAAAGIDLSDENGGVVFSFGEHTNVFFNLVPDGRLPTGEGYHVDISYDDVPIETYWFAVDPPPDAIASKLHQAQTSKGASEMHEPIEPTAVFGTDDEVHIVGLADLGAQSWISAEWTVNGAAYPDCTRSVTGITDNLSNTGFTFSCHPEQGWPAGSHEGHIRVNGKIETSLLFSVENE